MNCPKCQAPNLRSIVEVIIDRPAGPIGVNKKTIADKDTVILAVDWPNETLLCFQCKWRSDMKEEQS